MASSKAIKLSFKAIGTPEGVGAYVNRTIGTSKLPHLSPFLLFDHAEVQPGAGFPDHPHRGQETISYMLQGATDHEDFAGNKGRIGPGDLQFMTAGRGIMHSEIPADGEVTNVGVQIWVDLPESLKDCEPRYRDLRAEEIPVVKDDKLEIKVISGRSQGVESVKDLAYTPVWYFDVTIQPGGKLIQEIPHNWTSFAHTLEGKTTFEGKTFGKQHMIVFEQEGENVIAQVEDGAKEPGRFLLLAGQPHNQRIVKYGPFVTTSEEKLRQAFLDFRTASNGFERAAGWKSSNGRNFQ